MKSSTWILCAAGLTWQVVAIAACGSSNNNAPAPVPDAGSYVSGLDAASSSSSSAYSVPSNMLPGMITVVYPDGSAGVDATALGTDAAAAADSRAPAADATEQ